MLKLINLVLATILWVSALALALLAVMGLLGFTMPHFDGINNFRPVIAAGALVLILLASLLRFLPGRFASAAMGFIALLTSLVTIVPEYASSRTNGASGDESCKFSMLNLSLGNNSGEPAALPAYLDEIQADFVAIHGASRLGTSQYEQIGKAYGHSVSCSAERNCDLTLFSRHTLAKQPLKDISPDTMPPLLLARAKTAATCQPVTLAVTQLAWPDGDTKQSEQMIALASTMRRRIETGTHVVLAGNFNATPWSVGLSQFPQWAGLSRATYGVFTWPARPITKYAVNAPAFMPLDHVFVSPGLRVVDANRGEDVGADHYPVVTTIAIAADASAAAN